MKLPVCLHGTVESGKKIGRRLGFPTANISCEKKNASIANGVYIATLALSDGIEINGVANMAFTYISRGPPTMEIHLLNFSGEIYDQDVTLKLLKFLRPEIRFSNSEELKKQVFKDIETAEKYFSGIEKEDIC